MVSTCIGDVRECETGTEVKTDPECSGCLPEWLQRLGMVSTLGKIRISLPGISGLIDGSDCLNLKNIYFLIYSFILCYSILFKSAGAGKKHNG